MNTKETGSISLPEKYFHSSIGDISFYSLGKKEQPLAASIWKMLQKVIPEVGLTCEWEWIKTWLDQYSDVIDYRFIIAMQADTPCGAVLLTKETHRRLPIPVKAYHLGTNGEPFSERIQMLNNRLLVKDEIYESFLEGVLQIIAELGWEEIIFDEFNAKHAVRILSLLQKHQMQTLVQKHACRQYDFTIDAKSKSIIETLSYDTRYSIRRSLKVFNNEIQVDVPKNKKEAMEFLDELIFYYQKTWENLGRRGMFSAPRFRNFHREIISALFDDKKVLLFRVKNPTYGTLGCLSLFVDNGVAYGSELGFNDFADVTFESINRKRLRTGFIIHTACMQVCKDMGLKAYNFGLGEYAYKKELTNSDSEVVSISVRNGIKPRLRDDLVNLYTKLNENKNASLLTKIIQKIV